MPVSSHVFPDRSKEASEAQTYVVAEGEVLAVIAERSGSTVERIFNANPIIEHPDLIEAGEKIRIPYPNEPVAERVVQAPVASPAPPQTPQTPAPAKTPILTTPALPVAPRPFVGGGNTYSLGYCTWHVKNRKPSIGGFWGDASDWLGAARADGFATGSVASPGAVAWEPGHVSYVESVNADGSANVSEMNYYGNGGGWNIVSYRTIPAGRATYIY